MEFRNDINALRALAVTVVIFFHFNVPGFSGGFVGVDIFLVLSGYLMTRIIVTRLDSENFTFLAFYQARAKRIIPALIFLCVALLLFGFFYLPTSEFKSLAREIKSSLLFYSNIKLANADGYFATPPSEQWLLHTWSLSVEWQFYILYPAIIFMIYKVSSRQALSYAVIMLTVFSYAYSIYLTRHAPNDAFYLLPTRAAELLVGGIVYFMPALRQRWRGAALIGGFALLLLSLILLSERSAWPGYLVGLPAIGTACILMASSNLRVFKVPQIQYLGAISYSAYLWHWPVVVLFYFCGFLGSPLWIAIGISLSLTAASFSYHFIERRFMTPSSTKRSLAKYGLVSLLAVVTTTGVASATSRHPEIRPSALWQKLPKYTSMLYEQTCTPNPYCAAECLLGKGDVRVILFGDSHAQSHAAALQVNNQGAAIEWALGGCPLISNVTMKDKAAAKNCQRFVEEKLQRLNAEYEGVPVVLFNHYSIYLNETKQSKFRLSLPADSSEARLIDYYAKQFEPIVCNIRSSHPVYLVRPTPEMPFTPYTAVVLQSRLLKTTNDVAVSFEDHARLNADANRLIDHVAKKCDAQIIDPTPWLCPNGRCLGTLNMKPLYFDNNHLIDDGNLLMHRAFSSVFEN